MNRPKYSRTEFERRWLVSGDAASLLEGPAVRVVDRYLDGGRLRLRRMESGDGVVHKLCKKYGDAPAGSESITNLYLAPAEYAALARLPGTSVEKRRHRVAGGSLDVYLGSAERVCIWEREFADADAAAHCLAPAFCGREVTGRADYAGAALARRFGRASAPPEHPAAPIALRVLAGEYTVHRLPADAALPDPLRAPAGAGIRAMLRSPDELSLCCPSDMVIHGSRRESGWVCLAVEGPLDFSLTGIVAALTTPLAAAAVPVFVISSFDTDFLLVKQARLADTLRVLADHGMRVAENDDD